MKFRRVGHALGALGVVAAAVVAAPPAQAGGGHLDGFATTDFLYLDALDTSAGTLGQVTLSQAAAGASTKDLTTKNALGENVLDAKAGGANAYGHAAGVSANLGSPPGSIPQIRETLAEATSPPPSAKKTSLVDVPADPLLDASVLPSTAEANTRTNTGDPSDFCPTLGGPISAGSANVAAASLVSTDQVAPGFALASVDSTVHNTSLEALASNGAPNHFGLASQSTLETAGLTLFKGIDGAQTTIKVINPVTLRAFASGLAKGSTVDFGDKGDVPLVKIVTSQGAVELTLNQLLGGGVTIDLDGLLKVEIALHPKQSISADGTKVTASADLVHVQVIGASQPSQGSVGGPLGSVLDPILGQVFNTLDDTGLFQQIDDALSNAGITTAADLRVGHFEATAQVPAGGVECSIPVTKTADPKTVQAGNDFVYTITVDNPFSCVLDPVKLIDHITADNGVLWHVKSTDPQADSVSDDKVVWNNIGPIKPRASKQATITVHVAGDSGAGVMVDHAVAKGVCNGSGEVGNATVTVTGETTVTMPQVLAGPPLPETGNSPWLPYLGAGLIGAGALGAGWVRRRRKA